MKSQDVKVVIPCCKSYDFVILANIVRCEGLQNYTRIYLSNGTNIISSCNIGTFKETLGGYDFYCCHKSHLINTKHIIRYHKDGQVEMSNKTKVPVSRRKKEDFYSKVIERIDIRTERHKILPLVKYNAPMIIQK